MQYCEVICLKIYSRKAVICIFLYRLLPHYRGRKSLRRKNKNPEEAILKKNPKRRKMNPMKSHTKDAINGTRAFLMSIVVDENHY